MAQDRLQKSVQGIKDPTARKAAYYKLQREDAEETSDQKTTDKIYSKMNKKSHNVDTAKGDKAILATAPFLASGGAEGKVLEKGAEALGSGLRAAVPKFVEGAAKVGSKLKGMLPGGSKTKALSGSARKALPRSAAPAMKNVTPKNAVKEAVKKRGATTTTNNVAKIADRRSGGRVASQKQADETKVVKAAKESGRKEGGRSYAPKSGKDTRAQAKNKTDIFNNTAKRNAPKAKTKKAA